MKTLVIETSAEIGSLAVVEDGRLLAESCFSGGRGHAGRLFPRLAELLQEAGRIDEVVAGVGPGGYSGLRVGISAALGLKIGRGIPASGICSLLGFPLADYQVVLDARGSWIFALIRDEKLVDGPVLLDESELPGLLQRQLPIYSSAEIPGGFAILTESPRASILARRHGLQARLPLDPLYLKPPHITAARRGFRWPEKS